MIFFIWIDYLDIKLTIYFFIGSSFKCYEKICCFINLEVDGARVMQIQFKNLFKIEEKSY